MTQSLETETEYTWVPPAFSSMPPTHHSSIVLENDHGNPANFMRAAKWYVRSSVQIPPSHRIGLRSPDGASVLGHCENGTFQLFELCVFVRGSSDRFNNYPSLDRMTL